ncbi:MAG: hypothetical protein ACRDBM_07980, partial [Sporomusa sp.]
MQKRKGGDTMGIKDRRIGDWVQPISSLADKPQLSAAELKAAFDANANEIKPKVNGLIDDLAAGSAAGEIGFQATAGVSADNVQAAVEDVQRQVKDLSVPVADAERRLDGLNKPEAAAGLGFQATAGVNAGNVQAAVEDVQRQVANAVAGQIPDASIGLTKLDTQVQGQLAQTQTQLAQAQAHASAQVSSSTNGVHGFRFTNDKLAVQLNGEWVEVKTGGAGIKPGDVTGIRLEPGAGAISLYFNDPTDVVWAGTKVVMKAGAVPIDETDGIIILDNKVRGKYANSPFKQPGLTMDVVYYFGFFPYNNLGGFNYNLSNTVFGSPMGYRVMTAIIDKNNSNPDTCVTYADDAGSMAAGAEAWDEFFGHYPVLFRDGAEVGRLNKKNFAQFESGAAADITSGNAGDVMIAFPKRGFRITQDYRYITIKMTDNPKASGFYYFAHSGSNVFYLGAYKGSIIDEKLRSLSGQNLTSIWSFEKTREYAKANGSRYEQSAFYQLTYRQIMFILKYKSLNSQKVVGRGYVDGNTAYASTGGTNTKGMDWGEITGKQQVKLFGIEDFWGNCGEWIEGLHYMRCEESYDSGDWYIEIEAASRNFSLDSSYQSIGYRDESDINGFMSDLNNSNQSGYVETGFLGGGIRGSSTTYFCDGIYIRCWDDYEQVYGVYGGGYA